MISRTAVCLWLREATPAGGSRGDPGIDLGVRLQGMDGVRGARRADLRHLFEELNMQPRWAVERLDRARGGVALRRTDPLRHVLQRIDDRAAIKAQLVGHIAEPAQLQQ